MRFSARRGRPAAAVWLATTPAPGDTATVLYGAPNILQASGLASPYPELWSLPVRVRDPQLTQLRTVLEFSAPRPGCSPPLTTWAPGASTSEAADAVVVARYEPVGTVDRYTVYHLRTGANAVRHSVATNSPAGLRFSDPSVPVNGSSASAPRPRTIQAEETS